MSGSASVPDERSFRADPSVLYEVRRMVDGVSDACGFDPDACWEIKLAANEAAANAVVHGSRSRADQIEVRAEASGPTLVLHVKDGGSFTTAIDPADGVPDRGRGLGFIAQLMDEVCVRSGAGGTHIRLSKRLAA